VFPAFVVSAPLWDTYIFGNQIGSLGRLRAYQGALANADVYAPGCAGTQPSAPRIGIRGFGGTTGRGQRIHLSGAAPGRQAVLAIGTSRTSWLGQRLPLALDPFGFPGCALATSVEVLVGTVTGTTRRESGYAHVDVPALPSFPPVDLHAQWIILDPSAGSGGATSDALWWQP